MKKIATPLALFALALLLRGGEGEVRVLRPAPAPITSGDRGMDEEVEERGHEERAAWFERMHKAPPGVDWRAIEAENGAR